MVGLADPFYGAEAGPGEVGYLVSDPIGIEPFAVGYETATRRLGQANESGRQEALVFGVDVGADEGGDGLGHCLLDAAYSIGELLVAARPAAEKEQELVPIGGHPAEVGDEALHDLGAGAGGVARGVGDQREQPMSGFLEQREVQLPFGHEMLVQNRLGDAGGVGDVVHRRGVKALPGEHLECHGHQLHPAGGGRQAHGHDQRRLQAHSAAVLAVVALGRLYAVPEHDRRREQQGAHHQAGDHHRHQRATKAEGEADHEHRHGHGEAQVSDPVRQQGPAGHLGAPGADGIEIAHGPIIVARAVGVNFAVMADTYEALLYDVAAHVATVTINRPERRNAMSWTVMTELRRAIAAAKADPDVRVVVLTGAGDKAFSAGADLGGVREGAGFIELHYSRGEMVALFEDMWSMGKPTVARVRGYALAGGMGLALACDLVIAADDAVFATPEIDVGMWPMMITVPLLRSMPVKRALELMMTGRRVGAVEGERIGFVTEVVSVD
ncbi:MAG: hypothetical protein QOD72_2554, partial [Acidimicrobiaceae bacterium]|nr:hypothetical protein [Acidimicrobiaceae bacterium]